MRRYLLRNKNIFRFLCTGIFSVYAFHIYCQTIDSAQTDTAKKKSFFITPIIYYQPETNLALGAGAIYYVRPSVKYPLTNASLLKLYGVYTLNDQYQFEFSTDLYLRDNKYLISFLAGYYNYPLTFFGIGNYTQSNEGELYTLIHPYLRINAQQKISKHISLGFKTFFEHTKISDINPGGLIDSLNIPGENGGFNTGEGIWFTFDNRNDIYYPLTGWYIDISNVIHDKILGSDFNYDDYVMEISKYFNTRKRQVLAFNYFGKLQPGNPPFNQMAQLGGPFHMRGNYEGKYRDKYYMALQAEYRMPVWKILGATFFAGTGEVANAFDAFSLNGLKYSVGGGVRVNIFPGDKINLRIDYGFGSAGDNGLYIQFNEAF